MMIKGWFLDKNFSANERMVIIDAIMGDSLNVVKESEKAVNFKAVSDYGNITFWVPKSCICEESAPAFTTESELTGKIATNKMGEKVTVTEVSGDLIKCDNGKTYLKKYLKF